MNTGYDMLYSKDICSRLLISSANASSSRTTDAVLARRKTGALPLHDSEDADVISPAVCGLAAALPTGGHLEIVFVAARMCFIRRLSQRARGRTRSPTSRPTLTKSPQKIPTMSGLVGLLIMSLFLGVGAFGIGMLPLMFSFSRTPYTVRCY